jgi:spore coat polysaccharide biosynthesis protein SpsF
MGSSRLPGKVLKQIGGRPMLSYQLERLRAAKSVEQIVIATTIESADSEIADFCAAHAVPCFRGSETDVLARYAGAAEMFGASVVLRVTSDCPLLDPCLVDLAVSEFLSAPCDYLSNMLEPSWPYGMAVEVFPDWVLKEANLEARLPAEREHVTPFIYWRKGRYRLRSLVRRPDLSFHRWTVDTPEDLELVSRILEAIYAANPMFTMEDVLHLLDQNPSWVQINAHIHQKEVARGQ